MPKIALSALLSTDSAQTAELSYLLPYHSWDDTHFRLLRTWWRCVVAVGAKKKYFSDGWHKITSALISFSEMRSKFRIDGSAIWKKSDIFFHPTSVNWSAPKGEILLSEILMCEWIYGRTSLQGKETVWTFKLVFYFGAVYITAIHSLKRSPALPRPWAWNPYVWLCHPPSVLLYFLMNRPCGCSPKLKDAAHLSAICQQLVIWLE